MWNKLFASLPRISYLLIFFPVSLGLHLAGVNGTWLFITSALAILGTVTIIGKATEEYAIYAGPVWGGLMNATFGNVTELIIALLALKAGMYEIVRASITGSILGNLLLVLGAAMFYGGLKHQTQSFSRTSASANTGMLWLALTALVVPSIVTLAYRADPSLNLEAARVLS